jgi:hypothetical protein
LPRDIVDLRTYLNRNFAFGSFFTFVVGIGMYGTTYFTWPRPTGSRLALAGMSGLTE